MKKITHLSKNIFKEKHTKIFFGFIAILMFFTTLGIAARSYFLYRTIIPSYELILQKKLKTQIANINLLLDENKNQADMLAADPVILDFMEKALQGDGSKEENLLNYLMKRQENIGFRNITLIANDSSVLFSTTPLLRNITLNKEEYIDTPLVRSFSVSSISMAPDFSDIAYSKLIKAPAFYITVPLIRNMKILGMIAYQIDEEKLTTIVRDYLDLGTTGETVLAVQTGTLARFIAPTRNAPSIRFTTQEIFGESGFETIKLASQGESGAGSAMDYRGEKTLAAWSFIPRVDWAVIVKINLAEVREPIVANNKYIIIGAIIFFIFALLFLYSWKQSPGKKWLAISNRIARYIPKKIRHAEFLLFLIFLVLSLISIYKYKKAESDALHNSQDLAISEIKSGITRINTEIEKIVRLADFIAQDLRTERLISKDIRRRLRREIVETDGLVRITIAYAPYKHASHAKLYAPSITQKDNGTIHEELINDIYDYTDKNEGALKVQWYTQTMDQRKPQWLNPSIDPYSNTRVITYTIPFFFNNNKEDPAGVIAINYKLRPFAEIARNIGIGETGYSFIISHDQVFLFHPTLENSFQIKTLSAFAQEEGIEELEYIAAKIKEGNPILQEFSDESFLYPSWIYSHPISIPNWTIATVFSSKEVVLPSAAKKDHFFDIIIYLSITALLAIALICRSYTKLPFFSFLNFSNFILVITIILLWYSINLTSDTDGRIHIVVPDQSSVNKFIYKQQQEAQRKNEPVPVPIQCGIELYSLQQTGPKEVSFSGYLWHRYHKYNHKGIQRLIIIPQATNFDKLNELKASDGNYDVLGINFNAKIYNEINFAKYPFVNHRVLIPFEQPETEYNILLVPDLISYTNLNPDLLPGLDTTFSYTNFNAIKSYFEYYPHKRESDWGIRKYKNISESYRLAFNTEIKGDLLASFIYFFLPLLVILISIFCILKLENRKSSGLYIIGPYTGLLFTLVLLQRSLHEAVPSSGVLYIEYAFFYTYIVLIVLVVHALVSQQYMDSEYHNEKVVPFLKVIFWPIQLLAWIITTLIIFN